MNLPTIVFRQSRQPIKVKQKVELITHTTEDNFVRISTTRDLKIKVNYPADKSFYAYTMTEHNDFDNSFNFRCTERSVNSFAPNLFIRSVVNQAVEENQSITPHYFPRYISISSNNWHNLSLVFTNNILFHSLSDAAIYSLTNDYVSYEDLRKQRKLLFPRYFECFGMLFKSTKFWHIGKKHEFSSYVNIDGVCYGEITNARTFTQNNKKIHNIMLDIISIEDY